MNKTAFALYRAVFIQPKGMVLNIVKSKLRREPRREGEVFPPPPIDLRYGIDTGGIIPASALRTGARADLQNFGYEGAKPSAVRAAIDKTPDLESAVFMDFGCGKGRPLVVASEYPFRRIIGVELSPALADVAKSNAARIAADYPERTSIEVVEGDATLYEPPQGYLVLFLYNPAYAPLLRRVARMAADRRDKTIVIYVNPASGRVFDGQAGLTRYFAVNVEAAPDELGERGARRESVVAWQNAADPTFPPHVGATTLIRYQDGMGNID